jgi:putative hydrolase of the HAD superfamily
VEAGIISIMIKAILFDVDGLVLKARKRFFSEKLAEEQGISNEAVTEFFLGNFKKCTLGQADLKEEIAPFLEKWKWQGSVDDLLNYWFESESTKDEDVLKIITALRNKGIKCYIATRQEKYRFEYLLEEVGLKEYFDGAFCTCNIGYDKNDERFYKFILQEIHLQPSEMLFFDDTQSNVDTAKELGMESYFYSGIEILKEHTDPLFT